MLPPESFKAAPAQVDQVAGIDIQAIGAGVAQGGGRGQVEGQCGVGIGVQPAIEVQGAISEEKPSPGAMAWAPLPA